MKKALVHCIVVTILLLFITTLSLQAQESAFKWGLSERVRHTYMNNNMDFNADKDDEQGFYADEMKLKQNPVPF